MKLREWAQRQGISYRTAFRRFHAGEIPNSRQNPENKRIYVDMSAEECGGACCEDIHIRCLVEKLTADDVKALAAKLRAEGYVLKHVGD